MRLLACALALCSSLSLAQTAITPTPVSPPPAETPPPQQEEKDNRPLIDRSKWVVRGGITFDFSGVINLGGSSTTYVGLGLNGGVGYFIIPRLELDLDTRLMVRFSPSPVAVSLFEITPGARWRPIDRLQLRVGVPIPLVPQAGVGILAGLAFIQPISDRVSFVAGADYTYYFTEYWRNIAPSGRIEFHAGVQAYF